MSPSDEHTSWHYFFFCLMIVKIFVLTLDSHGFQALVPHQQAELYNFWYTSFAIKLLLQTTAFRGFFWSIFSDLAPESESPSKQSEHLFIMNSRGLSTWRSLSKNFQYLFTFFCSYFSFQTIPSWRGSPLEAAVGLYGGKKWWYWWKCPLSAHIGCNQTLIASS